jgi:hypothetical protein
MCIDYYLLPAVYRKTPAYLEGTPENAPITPFMPQA